MPEVHWHNLDVTASLQRLASGAAGLTGVQAQQRLAEYGPNRLPAARRRSLPAMFMGQFADFMILVLVAAALVAGLIGEPQDTLVILVIVLLNAVIGTVQEYRAERAVAALHALAAPEARVLRDGRAVSLDAAQLVPGDVVLLEAGNVVPADLRLLEAAELQADESALTGESGSVDKQTQPVAQSDVPPGDRTNLAYKTSLITRGRGRGVVIATGLHTEIGRIAELLGSERGVQTPLQRRLARFGRHLALAVLAICLVVFVAGLLQGQPVMLMLLTAVSLAVAAIPEALPAVVTVSLALGARQLIRHNALVRKLPAVETLGSVTYICADKTGTLTQNRMTAELFVAAGEQRDSLAAEHGGSPWTELGRALALNNDVTEIDDRAAGEPTELALFQAAQDAGFVRQVLEHAFPRLAVIAFDSERKRMTTLHRAPGGVMVYMKGAPEAVLPRCSSRRGVHGAETLHPEAVLAMAARLAGAGYRVLAVAQRELPDLPEPLQAEAVERDLVLLGLVALIDPPRPEAAQAVADCQAAGITPVMITGDHPGTARAIAERLGMMHSGARLMTGAELARLSDAAYARLVGTVRVYARVSPEQKVRIVRALQARGEFVAMTGDGINDAPALKRAGIGVAMGQRGTDVAREAADMVLLDDNFATIVKAVQAGRRIFDNIRKFIKYTMSSNSGEIWTLFLAPFLGLPIPLLPIHILWINLVTDGLPGLALAAEPAGPGIMTRRPRPPQENIFAHGMWQHILWVGLLIGGLSIASQSWALARGVEHWQTVVFTVLTVAQLFHALAVRSESDSLLVTGIFSNPPMLGALAFTLLLQLAVIYVPALNGIFHTRPLPPSELALCLAIASLVLVAVEFEKVLIRRGRIYREAGGS